MSLHIHSKVILVAMLTMILVMAFTPIVSFAGGAEDINVSMSSNGGINVSSGEYDFDSEDGASVWDLLFGKLRGIVTGISGIATIVMVAMFVVNLTKLGASSGNDNARSKAITGLLLTGIAAIGLGSLSLFFGFFYNVL